MFADTLKALRVKNNLTQKDFADVFNVAQGAVAMWESGKRTPDLEMIKRIAGYFNVTIDELVGNSVDRNGLDDTYFSFAKRAQKDGIAPEDIELAIKTIQELRYRNKGEG